METAGFNGSFPDQFHPYAFIGKELYHPFCQVFYIFRVSFCNASNDRSSRYLLRLSLAPAGYLE
jgi:hypothetical protein